MIESGPCMVPVILLLVVVDPSNDFFVIPLSVYIVVDLFIIFDNHRRNQNYVKSHPIEKAPVFVITVCNLEAGVLLSDLANDVWQPPVPLRDVVIYEARLILREYYQPGIVILEYILIVEFTC